MTSHSVSCLLCTVSPTITPLVKWKMRSVVSCQFFLSMCSSNTYWQYSHCIWLKRRDLIPFFFHNWTVEVSRSEKWGGPGLDDMKGGGGRGQLDAGHQGIFSYGFRSPLQWVIMQCWSVVGAVLPSSHMRGCAFPCGHTDSREPRRKVFGCK